MLWDTQGDGLGRASIVLLTDILLEPKGHYRLEFDLGEFELIEGPNLDYSLYFGLVGANYDRAILSPWVQTEPLLTVSLIADAVVGINMVTSYKDGSGTGPNGPSSNRCYSNTRFLPDWDGKRIHTIWIEIHEGKVRAGWSGGEEVVGWSAPDPRHHFPEPDLSNFTKPMRLFMLGHNGMLSKEH